jgi:hypothetical protein
VPASEPAPRFHCPAKADARARDQGGRVICRMGASRAGRARS